MEFFTLTWVILLPLSLISIYKYYQVRKRDDLKKVKMYQPLTTIISLIISILSLFSPLSSTLFTILIIFGMFLALIADFLNIDMKDISVVIRGLLIFFVSYLIYTISTFILFGMTNLLWIPILIMSVIFIIVFSLANKGIKEKFEKIAMGAYGFLISMMAASGLGTLFNPDIRVISSVLLALGFCFLCAGDFEFALSNYWKNLNFPFGPVLYAGGQLLVSISLFYITI